ncbi:MAG: zf-HC2 domain-containing protein [Bacteroidales bacterium]|nr:zf-HC2 domain-containing protein [Bacteroidales bacterium]
MEVTQLIEKYLDGSLDETERQRVEEHAANDSEFRDLIRLHREVDQSISDNELAAFQQAITEVETAYLQVSLPAQNSLTENHSQQWISILRIAAIVILIAGAGITMGHLLTRKTGPEKIYARYYAAYEIDGTLRSSSSVVNQVTLAIADYSQGKYAEAIETLNGVVKTDAGNYVAWFFRGLACLGTDDADDAIRSFRTIPITWDSPCVEHRDWYLALAYLRVGEITEASLLFSAMVQNNGYYTKSAGDILKRLRF